MTAIERALRRMREPGIEKVRNGPPVARLSAMAAESRVVRKDERLGQFSLGRQDKYVEFDLDALRKAGLYAVGDGALADQYRAIKHPLLRQAASASGPGGDRLNLLMVASAVSGEGKTFTSLNLGISLASEKDWSALLVDTDSHNPRLTELLGAQDEPGLLNVLSGEVDDVDSLVLRTSVADLSVLPLGNAAEHSAELLASKRMSEFAQRLAESNRRQFVIFDSPPLLMAPDGPILAGHIGQIALVVKAGSTPRQVVGEALEKLDPTKAIGLILNQAEAIGTAVSYGGYSSHSYGHA